MTFLPDVYFKLIEQPGFEHAIVAGGFIRDSVMRGPIKDLDVFIPCNSQDDFIKKVKSLEGKDILQVDTKEMTEDGYSFSSEFVGKYDALDGQLEIDLCGYIYRKKHPFGFASSVLDTFHYDIDQGYSTGHYPIVTNNQQRDIGGRMATLARVSTAPDGGNSLLHSLRKFDRLKEKYPDLTFNCELNVQSRRGEAQAVGIADWF